MGRRAIILEVLMDAGVGLVIGAAGIVAVVIVAWFLIRRRVPQEVVAEIAALVAALHAGLGEVITRAEVEQVAGFIYDTFAASSKYISREQFIELVWRALNVAKTQEPVVARKVRQINASRSNPM